MVKSKPFYQKLHLNCVSVTVLMWIWSHTSACTVWGCTDLDFTAHFSIEWVFNQTALFDIVDYYKNNHPCYYHFKISHTVWLFWTPMWVFTGTQMISSGAHVPVKRIRQGLRHRQMCQEFPQEFTGMIQNLLFYNGSNRSNPDAAKHAQIRTPQPPRLTESTGFLCWSTGRLSPNKKLLI